MSLLKGVLSISAAEIGKQIGLGTVSSLTKGIWSLLGTDPTSEAFQQISDKLDSIMDELGEVRTAISALKTQIANLRIDIKLDALDGYANDVEALYDQYVAAVEVLVEATKDMAAKIEGAEAKRDEAQRRTTALGVRISNEIYAHVKQIDSLLAGTAERSLLYLVNEASIGRDFLSYFTGMKSVCVKYYLVQAKAYYLIGVAGGDPDVGFVESPALLTTVEAKMADQEKFMLSLIPDTVPPLIEALANHADAAPIYFRPGAESVGVYFGHSVSGSPPAYTTNRVWEWALTPSQPISDPDPQQDYYFTLTETENNIQLILSGSQYGAVGVGADPKMKWKIRCAVDGKFWLEFKGNYYGGSYDGCRLSIWRRDGKQERLYYDTTADDAKADQQFKLTPYRGGLIGDIMFVRQHLGPGVYLESANGAYRLHYRDNGALEVVATADDAVIWRADTAKSTAWRAQVHDTGEFAVYAAPGEKSWTTNTVSQDIVNYQNAKLIMNDDGSLSLTDRFEKIYWTNKGA